MHSITRARAGSLALAIGALVFAAALGFAHLPGTASALTNCTVSDNTFDSQESAFLTLINNYRAQNGLAALTLSTNLNRSSSWLAVDMAQKNYFSHTDSLGRDPSARAEQCGYPSGAGENIAAGTVWDTAQEAFDAWRNSAGHNANMLNASYRQIGIARYFQSGSTYGWYWVTDFGLVNDGTSGSGSGSGGTTTTTPPPASTSKGAITSPAAGSTLAGKSVTFNWSAGNGALEYFLYAGSSAGSNSYFGQSIGTGRSATISSLPTNGSTVYVRLWTRFSSGWQYTDYTYHAASAVASTPTPPPAGTSAKASLTSPAPGSALGTGARTFSWSAATGAQQYFFYVGTSAGSNNVYGQSTGLNRSVTVTIPAHTHIYVRLWTLLSSGWVYTDYVYN